MGRLPDVSAGWNPNPVSIGIHFHGRIGAGRREESEQMRGRRLPARWRAAGSFLRYRRPKKLGANVIGVGAEELDLPGKCRVSGFRLRARLN